MKRIAFAMALVVAISGCERIAAAYRIEVGSPGGIGSRLADRFLPVASIEGRADRHLITLVLAAVLAAETAETKQDAATSAEQINGIYGSITELMNSTEVCRSTYNTGGPCADINEPKPTVYTFETLEYSTQKAQFRLLQSVLDGVDVERLVGGITGLDVASVLALFRKARDVIPVLRRFFASYRDTAIVVSGTVYDACKGEVTAMDAHITATKRINALKANDDPSWREVSVPAKPANTDLVRSCRLLGKQLAKLGRSSDGAEKGPIDEAITKAKDVMRHDDFDFNLTNYGRRALVHQIDLACDRLARAQISKDDSANDLAKVKNCGAKPGWSNKIKESEERKSYLGAIPN